MTDVLAFDTTALSHFARAGELDALQLLVAGWRCVVPEQVSTELVLGTALHPALGRIASLHWLEIVELIEVNEIVEFARYKAEFGGGPDRNNGEAAVLAWVAIHGGTALIDEHVATRAAQRDNIPVHGTLWLIANAFRKGALERPAAERMVDALADTDMRLPTNGAGFFAWAFESGLLP